MKQFTCLLFFILLGFSGFAQTCQAGFSTSISQGSVTFTSTSTGLSNFSDYSWNFGNGNFGSGQSTTHTYTSSGTYVVCLSVFDSTNFCSSTFCDSVMVTVSAPTCQANFTSSISGGNVVFTNNSTGLTAAAGYAWDFNDGNFGTDENPSHTYTASGTYVVCLTTFDSTNFCSSTFCDSITISLPTTCDAQFMVSEDSTNAGTFSFNLQTTAGTTYSWDFGDGNTSTQATPNHTFTGAGPWNVCLTTTNGACTETYCDSVFTEATPVGIADYLSNALEFNAFYPNPVNNLGTLNFESQIQTTAELTIVNALGQVFTYEAIAIQRGENVLPLDLSQLSEGVYFVRLNARTGNGQMTQRIIKQ